jgi:hypothetical protein
MSQAGLFGPLYYLGYLAAQGTSSPARGFKGAGKRSMIAYMLAQEAHKFLAEQEAYALRQEAARMVHAKNAFEKALRDANAAQIKVISTVLLAEI